MSTKNKNFMASGSVNAAANTQDKWKSSKNTLFGSGSQPKEKSAARTVARGPDTKQETIKPGIWQCSICTYDNDESMTSCDICGVVRRPLPNIGTSNSNKTGEKGEGGESKNMVLGLQQWPRYTYNLLNNVFGAVEDISKSPGASKLARSLFQSLPQQIPKEVVLFSKPGDGFLTDGSNFYKLENVQGEFHEIHKAFSTQSHPHLNIDPFKFDVPSPDDVVHTGLHSSKMGLKESELKVIAQGLCEMLWLKIILDNLRVKLEGPMKFYCDKLTINIACNPIQNDRTKHIDIDRHFVEEKLKDKVTISKSSQLSSSIGEKNERSVQSNAESSDNLSSLMRKSRNSSAESKLSKNVAIDLQKSGKTSNSLPESLSKDKGDNINKINSSKNGTIDIQSSKEKSDSLSALSKIKQSDNISFSSIKDGKPESISSSFNNMVLDVRSGNLDNTNAKEPRSHVSYKPEKWMLPQQAEDALTQLNLAIVGHVDSGKSTLSGRLLHLLGRISQKEMHKYEKEAKLQGKGSFAYAWALDESSEERERGITMTVAVAYFDTKKYHVVVLDSPGHKDFVPNMISGATQADAAILVIDASLGSFEAGMDGSKGQTREHAQLIRSFGVDRVIVAVNKMDAVVYSQERFDFIRQQLGFFLHSCGFRDSSLSWIPMSVMENQNLVASPSDARFKNWYGGPYLLDAIDSLQPPTREFSKPLLMPICDVIKSTMIGQASACGKLEAGALRSGSKVLVMPAAIVGTVRSLERDSNACTVARAGDNVAVTLQGIDGSHVMAGGVLCHPDFPVAVAKHLELKVLVLDGASPILVGAQLEFHIHHAKEPARVSRILSVLDPKTGKVTKKSPRCLTAKQSAVIEVILHESVCVVEFSRCKALGRVSLRSLGRTIAVGVVTRIVEEQGLGCKALL
ncbi:HBS1-like protein, partial [Mucuna pruriens]